MSLRRILENVKDELTKKEKARETTYTDLRRAISNSKQAILFVHQEKLDEAKKLVRKAKHLIANARTKTKMHPELVSTGLFSAALQEYSEANILLSLVTESKYVSPSEIGVPPDDYVLGLSDVIGECRRLALDSLRKGNFEIAEKNLKIMDEIYVETMGMDESYMQVSGLRRKSDVARKIIEATRGDITQEARRNALETQMERLEKILKERHM